MRIANVQPPEGRNDYVRFKNGGLKAIQEEENDVAIQMTLLGDFQLIFDGNPISLAPCCQRLLVTLALRADLSRRAVAAQLWPERDESMARRCLRTAIWRLPKLGDISPVITASNTIILNSVVQVDINYLRDKLSAWLPGQAPPVGIDSLTLDLLPTWYDEWLEIERENQRQIRLHALERMSAWYAETNNFVNAIEAALQAIASDPLRESAHRCLMHAHLREGNIIEARHQLNKYLTLLSDAGFPTQISTHMRKLMHAIPPLV